MIFLLAIAACDSVLSEQPSLSIETPSDGAVLQVGAPVLLSAVVVGATVESAHWTAGDWAADMLQGEVTDLPYGDWTLTASAEADGVTLSDAVAISVWQVVAPTDFTGVLDLNADLHSATYGDYNGIACEPVALDLAVETDGTLVGEGSCNSPIGTYTFAITGQVDGAQVSGEMLSSAAPEALRFDGTRDASNAIQVTFDQEFVSGNDLLRLYGGFTASPSL